MVEQTNNTDAPALGASNLCPVCIERAQRDARRADFDAEQSARRRRQRAERDAYTPDATSETYDGPRDEYDGTPWPSCLHRYHEARDAHTMTPERARGRLHIQIRAHRAQIDALNAALESLE